MLTYQDVVNALPTQHKSKVSQEFVDTLNKLSSDPDTAQHIRDTFINYSSILREGRFKLEDYMNAVSYVSFKLMGYNNQEAYSRAFPKRYQALVARGSSNKEISAYVAAYSKNILVNKILEQTMIPHWILNQDAYQQAINTQVELMMYARSEKVRAEAANSILTHLKKPEKKEIELNIGMAESSGMQELKDMLTTLAKRQKELIGEGMLTREIAHQPLIDITPIEEKKEVVNNIAPKTIDIFKR